MDTEKELEQLKKKLAKAIEEQEEYLTGWKRAKADFINYKKEQEERKGEVIQFANQALLLKTLVIADSLERAEKEIPKSKKNDATIKGLLQIISQIQAFLKSEGVVPFDCVGKEFDPALHEAVAQEEGKKEKASGIVLEEFEKGYMMGDRLLRPAKVKISQ